MHKRLFALTGLLLLGFCETSYAEIDVVIGYLERRISPPPILSNLEEIPTNEGLAGAELGLEDNMTTGKFLRHKYRLEMQIVGEDEDILSAAKSLLAKSSIIVVKMPMKDLLVVSDLDEADNAILINAQAGNTILRDKECRQNVLHTIPSRAMLADALSQFAVKKKWNRIALIEGNHVGDAAFGRAIEQSAAKFRLKLVGKKTWAFDADMRRNASREVPLFTQDFPEHDLLVIADEIKDFGRYIMYNTWLPRPIAGSEGVVPEAWSASVEQHGAAQLQSRFTNKFDRSMRSIDYAAWVAMRSIGEAVTRTGLNDAKSVRAYMLSEKFEIGGFKGRKLTFRKWNGQMRQPIPLTHPRAVVALAPLEGFLHQRNELDTLGLDKAESGCHAFKE